MSAHFPKAKGKILGYNPSQVEDVITNAREQFANPTRHLLEHGKLRHSTFELVPGGYLISAVDAALERLDDAFAVQEVKLKLVESGRHDLESELSQLEELIKGRLARPKKRKFSRVSFWQRGYPTAQVDRLCNEILVSLQDGGFLDVEKLRAAEFRASWAGYAENQVDAFIDRAVELAQIQSVLRS